MKKPTIYEIKEATQENCPYFFDRKTMKAFGQTLHSFIVWRTDTENVFRISALSKQGFLTERWYVPGFGQLYLEEESAIQAATTGVDPYSK